MNQRKLDYIILIVGTVVALVLAILPPVNGFDWGIEVKPVACTGFDIQAVCDSLNASSDFNLTSCEPLIGLSNCTLDLGSINVFVANETINSNFSSYVSENHTINLDCVSSADFSSCMNNFKNLESAVSANCSIDYSLFDGFNESCPVFDYQVIKDSVTNSNSEQTTALKENCIKECPSLSCPSSGSTLSLLALIVGIIVLVLLIYLIFFRGGYE